jgi:hypothetical protein
MAKLNKELNYEFHIFQLELKGIETKRVTNISSRMTTVRNTHIV